MSRRTFVGAMAAGMLGLTGCTAVGESGRAGDKPWTSDTPAADGASAGNRSAATPVTADTLVSDVIGNPLFEGYGRLLFPTTFQAPTPKTTLGGLAGCLPWYSEVHTETTLDVINTLLDRRTAGEIVFHDIYTDEEKAASADLEDTGLFHFRSERTSHAPFAVWCAGGGFAYVAAMHDSFPHALALSRAGLNGFAVIYRPDAQLACDDLARAVTYIFDHAEELDVDTEGYALGGGSAGARMAAWVGGLSVAAFGGSSYIPQPAAVIMQYTGLSQLTGADPATYACVGTSDGIANWRTMESRLDALAASGVPTEFHAYEGLQHGFGLGIGTVAEGWIDNARAFWLENR